MINSPTVIIWLCPLWISKIQSYRANFQTFLSVRARAERKNFHCHKVGNFNRQKWGVSTDTDKHFSLGNFRFGNLRTSYQRCGKPNCHCAQPDDPGHGPYWILARTVKGKIFNRSIPRHALEATQEQIDNYHCGFAPHRAHHTSFLCVRFSRQTPFASIERCSNAERYCRTPTA